MIIKVVCHFCGKIKEVEVSGEGYHKWKAGMLIQRALPELSVEQRELLISHTCPACWNEMFPPEEDTPGS